MNVKHYSLIADLFDYPVEGFLEKEPKIFSFLQESYPEAANEVELFYKTLPKDSLDQLQELFTRSFDVQAITTLDVGYVLFGEDYKRGEILSNLNREHKKVNNDCGKELADYLPNLLRLLSKLTDEELVNDLVQEILAPAIKKMISEFDPEALDKKNKMYKKQYKTLIETSGNHSISYSYALKALLFVLEQDFEIKESVLSNALSKDFLNLVETEINIEKLADK